MPAEEQKQPGRGPLEDPLDEAVRSLFGLSYLFPYQRLVTANILEAAGAAGIPIRWPGETEQAGETAPSAETGDPVGNGDDGARRDEDRAGLGRQIVILPTGAGKSLCFQLPALLMEGPTLVIYPILGLMADQERRLRERGFSPLVLRGGQSGKEREALREKIRNGEGKFIIANPEVLLTPRVLGKIGEMHIVHIVVDEAHCVAEWGETFRPAYLEIAQVIEAAKAPLVTAFTATAGGPVLEKIEKYIFGGKGARRIIGNPDRPNISYAAQGCILRDLAVRDLLAVNRRPALVFCSSRRGTEKTTRYLRNEAEERGLSWHGEIRFYHAGLGREERTEIESWFLRSPEGVLVATCAFGLGIDKADIRTVIHRDCPPSVEAYLQESGRAGRDGEFSRAVLLFGPGDESSLGRAKSGVERRRLEKLLNYAGDNGHCRRKALLGLLNYEGAGDSPESRCCDVCEAQALGRPVGGEPPPLREESSLLDFFRRNKRCFSVDEAARVLARSERVIWSEKDAKQALNQLIYDGKLKLMKNILWKNKISL
ncbi:MAG: RecQ family ATP-dependent DNA helicase [Treponema sp.]|nr:RecQ family ATP-dependent DNA helicase [Treponema sp.]